MAVIPGILIAIGGRDWTVPPLTLGQLRQLMPKVRALTSIGVEMGEAEIGTILEVIAAALKRNYPNTTEEELADLVDLGNAREILAAVLTGSGLRPSAGEAAAVARPNGATYTDSSPPPAATAIR